MAKPSTTPRWATDGGAPITEPVAGRKDSGWAVADRPAAQHVNWLFNLIYLWLIWFDEVLDDIGVKRVRTYVSVATLRALTGYAEKDVAFVIGSGFFQYYPATAGDADDGVNILKPNDMGGGVGRWIRMGFPVGVGPGLATLNASSKVPDTQLNGFLAKKFGFVQTRTAGVSGSEAFTLSYPSPQRVRVTFASAMPDTSYHVTTGDERGEAYPGPTTANPSHVIVRAKAASYLEFEVISLATGLEFDLDPSAPTSSANELKFSFAIFD